MRIPLLVGDLNRRINMILETELFYRHVVMFSVPTVKLGSSSEH